MISEDFLSRFNDAMPHVVWKTLARIRVGRTSGQGTAAKLYMTSISNREHYEISKVLSTQYAFSNWGKVRNYIALLKLFLPFVFRRFPVYQPQVLLLHV